jgi:TolB protein
MSDEGLGKKSSRRDVLRSGLAGIGGYLMGREPLRLRGAMGLMDRPVHTGSLGAFKSQTDVGVTPRAGSAEFDPATGVYHVFGGGANIWDRIDAFHFVWRRMAGDLTLTANVRWAQPFPKTDRKAGWMVRQSLGPGAAYADAMVHGRALTALQYREKHRALTEGIPVEIAAPVTLRLARHGNTFRLWAAPVGKPLELIGATDVVLHDPVYVGMAVCAHNHAALEEAVFSDVRISNAAPNFAQRAAPVESSLQIISADGKERKVVYRAPHRFEAPNWSRDGKTFFFNSEGKIWTLPVAGGTPRPLDTGTARRCNNDHVLSPDGKRLAVSSSSQSKSLIYIVPSAGGAARLLTPLGPSYAHGWSPDGKTIAYCGERNGNFDVYTIPAEGGEERRLTRHPDLDDGPDYSPDGRYIYFCCVDTGVPGALMQIWRMKPDGTEQERFIASETNDWFPHPSPDGKRLVFLSYGKGVAGHPPNKRVALKIVSLEDSQLAGEPRVLVELFGGQGTINVPSWSPDSRYFAFVSYRLL